jgi:hypothetical protein
VPDLPVAYLLLHDTSKGDASRAKSILEKMIVKYGTANSFYLPINSNRGPVQSADNDVWAEYVNLEVMPGAIGEEPSFSRTLSMASLASDSGHHRMPSSGM